MLSQTGARKARGAGGRSDGEVRPSEGEVLDCGGVVHPRQNSVKRSRNVSLRFSFALCSFASSHPIGSFILSSFLLAPSTLSLRFPGKKLLVGWVWVLIIPFRDERGGKDL